jgi:transglutaminase-like putative cysteine protease
VRGPDDPPGRSDGAKLAVVHRTTFHYDSSVRDSVNLLHLEPRTFPYQRTLGAIVRVLPATRVRRFTDLFENVTHHFELPEPHDKLEIESRIRVQNLPLDLPDRALEAGVRDYAEPSLKERIWPFLQDSSRVARSTGLWHQAVDVTTGCTAVYEMARAIMHWIHAEFSYQSGVTDVNTHLSEVFPMRRGVCQDFSHVMIGMCRTIGVPARYASGYLYNGPRDHLVGAQASHAWCEVYLPGAGWIGFDPTNNGLADDRYVKVAVGRDYDDVAPVKGTYHGAGHCRMEVRVSVEKLA